MNAVQHPEAEYLAHLAQGRFMLLRAQGSGTWVHPPRVAAPGSGETDLAWQPACGRGTVHATTTVRCKPPAADYNVALIDLEEGPRLMSVVTGIAPAQVLIGMAVRARIEAGEAHEGGPRLVFEPAE